MKKIKIFIGILIICCIGIAGCGTNKTEELSGNEEQLSVGNEESESEEIIDNTDKISYIQDIYHMIENELDSYEKFDMWDSYQSYIDSTGMIRKMIIGFPEEYMSEDDYISEYYYDVSNGSEELVYTHIYNKNKKEEYFFYSLEQQLIRYIDEIGNVYDFNGDYDASISKVYGLYIEGYSEVDTVKTEIQKEEEIQSETNSFDAEAVREKILQYFTDTYHPDGEYVSFDTEDVDCDSQNYTMVIRYQMSDAETDELMDNGGFPAANTYVTEVYINKETGEVSDEWGEVFCVY